MKPTQREVAEFRARFGVLGEQERRTAPLASARAKQAGDGSGRLHVVGHAAVFNQPSVEMGSPLGRFVEFIRPGAFDSVLSRQPDVVLDWDHDTRWPLARTSAGNLELTSNAHGLRFFANVTPTSYAADLRSLMEDGVVSQASFLFTVAPGGEEWAVAEGSDGTETVTRTITQVGELYDVTVCVFGAYPGTDSGVARSLALDYALARGYLTSDPATATRRARALADLELRRRRAAAA